MQAPRCVRSVVGNISRSCRLHSFVWARNQQYQHRKTIKFSKYSKLKLKFEKVKNIQSRVFSPARFFSTVFSYINSLGTFFLLIFVLPYFVLCRSVYRISDIVNWLAEHAELEKETTKVNGKEGEKGDEGEREGDGSHGADSFQSHYKSREGKALPTTSQCRKTLLGSAHSHAASPLPALPVPAWLMQKLSETVGLSSISHSQVEGIKFPRN